MSISWQIPRNCLAWILVSQLVLLVPHAERLPWWVLAAYVVCTLWRIMVYQGRWSFPPKSVKVLLSLLCFVGIYRSYGTMIGLEPTVALLFSGFCLKLLEVVNKRDVYVIIFLAYFAALTQFLFSQDFLVSVLIFATLLLITTSLIALHQHSYARLNSISLRKAALIFMQAVPLMLVLFVVFPRFEPLWKVPLPSHQAKTGVSDSVSPGDISNLSQSGELAFRVVFEEAIPPRGQLYWRGLVLSEFDGRTWRQGESKKDFMTQPQTDDVLRQLKQPLRYSVIQEPSYQPWLFSLALAYSSNKNILAVNDYRLVYNDDIHTRIKYDISSDPKAKIQLDLDRRTRTFETQLPKGFNPQTQLYAQDLFRQSADVRDYIRRILRKFRQEEYIYTLKPPALGKHTVDEFLFDTRRGFCSHYASSFVVLMRAAGIPARMVAGYQGGEISPITGTVLVHQFDAHGWAEVWLEGEGWVRFDPTAAVSPDRIEYGLERAMQQEGSFLSDAPLSPLRYRDVAWLNKIRFQMDAFSFYWSSWVLQYKGQKQSQVLQKLLGEVSPWRVALLILGVGGIVLLFVAADLLKGRSRPKPAKEVQIYLNVCKRLERAGYKRLADEGAIDFAKRVAESDPSWKAHLLACTRAFVTLNYEPLPPDQRKAVLKQLRSESLRLSYLLTLRST
ncbi:transglutaminase TgpA family protein [Oceanicoccus sagamiensis]|uniref:Transglutaminase-like domain-containing protein n=1 Tax=Oceanicoccus sagamiensis TaxID=716816 RepID=A0A1X9ND12_9GAMM|nr:DUF3488 and transglutaminase-like domain-containing protein [Oceanicoccus sagamiensis]ARN75920.1 hypothetical protein BST96_18550 [Oceanicoccus sagamiensis]